MNKPSTKGVRHPGVMISSTYVDIKELREVLVKAALSVGFYPEVMEHDGALPISVVKSSLDRVARAEAYVLLIGHRYGQQPLRDASPPDLRSITEMEFDRACEFNRPTLLFILGDDYPIPARFVETDPEARTRLQEFRQRAKAMNGVDGEQRVYALVNSPADLDRVAERSMRALAEFLIKRDVALELTEAAGATAAPLKARTRSKALPKTSSGAKAAQAQAVGGKRVPSDRTRPPASSRSDLQQVIGTVAQVSRLPASNKLLLLTANRHETQALKKVFAPGAEPTEVLGGEQIYSYYGLHGQHHVLGVVAASLGAHDAHIALNLAAADLDCKHVIAVGIAFGAYNDRQTLGQVLIANEILGYDQARVNPDGTERFRDLSHRTSRYWLQRAQTRQHQPPSGVPAEHWPSAEEGTLLSGGKLIDNKPLRDQLVSSFRNRIVGGEMEGVGVAAAATADPQKREWIVIKAICDFADGNKSAATKEGDQQFAAWNAAIFVKSLIDLDGLSTINWAGRPPPPAAPFAAPTSPQVAAPPPAALSLPTEGAPVGRTTSAMRDYLDWKIQQASPESSEHLHALLQSFKPVLTSADDALASLESQPDSAHGFLAQLQGAVRSTFPDSKAGRALPDAKVVDVVWALSYLALERLVREKLGATHRAPAGAIPLPADAQDKSLHLLVGAMLSTAGVCISDGPGGAEAENVVTDFQPPELRHLSAQQAIAVEAHAKARLALLDEPMERTRGSYRGGGPDRHEIAAQLGAYAKERGGVRMVAALDLARMAEGQRFEDLAAELQGFGLDTFATHSLLGDGLKDVSDIAGQISRALGNMKAVLAKAAPVAQSKPK